MKTTSNLKKVPWDLELRGKIEYLEMKIIYEKY
jgi:hypothetical protein